MQASQLVCAACGWMPPAGATYPFACANAGQDDRDHLLEHRLDGSVELDAHDDANPFVRWRTALFAWHESQRRGWTDLQFIDAVRRIDDAVAAVDGQGFRVTPYERAVALGERLGLEVWIKDETDNVAQSHKARHLMGLLLALTVTEQGRGDDLPPLAIASCGNAALAAAVLAAAVRRALQVFVPPDAEPAVLQRLHRLGAEVVVCPREPGEQGDPCVRRFRQAVAAGALPFCCQGNENGLTIDGGQTLMLELLGSGALLPRQLFVQCGGGALASACAQALQRHRAAGQLPDWPRLHVVQTAGAAPLARAWGRVQRRMADTGEDATQALAHAMAHRSAYMWPWEEPPHSVAHGILDDETYDWAAVLQGVAASGGSTPVVDEDTLREANRLVLQTTSVRPSHTGSAGLAGLLQALRKGLVAPGERVAVLLTGLQR